MELKKLKIIDFKVGADIETFLRDKNTGKFITAEGIIKGTKENPYQFDPKNKYFATSLDCTSAEFNIPPVTNPYDLWSCIDKCYDYIKSILPNNLEITNVPAVYFEEDQLQTESAILFGCSPSLSCYEEDEIRPTPDGSGLRVIGGHFHVGYESPTKEVNREIIRAMDLFLGVPSILIEPKNERRISGYGVSGNYRHQKHGVEYRSLSSYFASEQKLVEWVFRNTKRAIDFVNNNDIKYLENRGMEIQQTINTEWKEHALDIVKEFNLELI